MTAIVKAAATEAPAARGASAMESAASAMESATPTMESAAAMRLGRGGG